MISRIEKWVEFSNKSRLGSSSVGESGPSLCNGNLTTGNGSVDTEEPGASKLAETDHREPTVIQQESNTESRDLNNPGFPLLPASKGFCLAITKHLECFKEVLSEHIFNSTE